MCLLRILLEGNDRNLVEEYFAKTHIAENFPEHVKLTNSCYGFSSDLIHIFRQGQKITRTYRDRIPPCLEI